MVPYDIAPLPPETYLGPSTYLMLLLHKNVTALLSVSQASGKCLAIKTERIEVLDLEKLVTRGTARGGPVNKHGGSRHSNRSIHNMKALYGGSRKVSERI